jgi:tetratricopeptide (TPR) repeat protein
MLAWYIADLSVSGSDMRPRNFKYFIILVTLIASNFFKSDLHAQTENLWPIQDAYTRFVKATTVVTSGKDKFTVAFMDSGLMAGLGILKNNDRVPSYYGLNTVSSALSILADARLSALWPALIEWGGPSLDKLRSRQVEESRLSYVAGYTSINPRNTAESTASLNDARPMMQYASTLSDTGDVKKAIFMLQQSLFFRKVNSQLTTDLGRSDYTLITLRLASALNEDGRVDEAIAALRDAEGVLGNDPYAINLQVNRAAFLAENGKYAEALTLIDQAQRDYEAQPKKNSERAKVAGSYRQFDWIRACALNGIDRTKEAKSIFYGLQKNKEPKDKYFVVSSNLELLFRAAVCMNNPDLVSEAFIENLNDQPLGSPVALLMQPSRNLRFFNREMAEQVRANPAVKAALDERMRILPKELEPALNKWQSSN